MICHDFIRFWIIFLWISHHTPVFDVNHWKPLLNPPHPVPSPLSILLSLLLFSQSIHESITTIMNSSINSHVHSRYLSSRTTRTYPWIRSTYPIKFLRWEQVTVNRPPSRMKNFRVAEGGLFGLILSSWRWKNFRFAEGGRFMGASLKGFTVFFKSNLLPYYSIFLWRLITF